MPNEWRTIKSLVHKIRLHGRRGKEMAIARRQTHDVRKAVKETKWRICVVDPTHSEGRPRNRRGSRGTWRGCRWRSTHGPVKLWRAFTLQRRHDVATNQHHAASTSESAQRPHVIARRLERNVNDAHHARSSQIYCSKTNTRYGKEKNTRPSAEYA